MVNPDSRHTKQRQLILRIIKLSAQPLTAHEVYLRVRKHLRGVGTATIYRNLDVLTRRGEVARVTSDHGLAQFVGHAFHQATFRCQRCHRVQHVPTKKLAPAIKHLQPQGSTVLFSRLTAEGLCAECASLLERGRLTL